MSSFVNNGKDRGFATPELWILGLGSQYPPYLLGSEFLEKIAARFYHTGSEGTQKLLAINKKTGIQTRAAISSYQHGFAVEKEPPSLAEIDAYFRNAGVDLAVQACEKALDEAGMRREDITHTVAVTCTNQGNPGYDLKVHGKLGLNHDIDRTLLHGVGCAGGLAIMRAAAQMALAATARGKSARILAFACELCTLNVRGELAAAERSAAADVSIAGALFSDGAAAFVLSNELGRGDREAQFQLVAFDNVLIPKSAEHISFHVDPLGGRTVLSRHVPSLARKATDSMFQSLVSEYSSNMKIDVLRPEEFDWALHAGGEAIIEGVKATMNLADDQLRATQKIYRTRGNSSSPTVLIVLDTLRRMGQGRDHVVAASFGPGVSVEMAMFRRRERPDDMSDSQIVEMRPKDCKDNGTL